MSTEDPRGPGWTLAEEVAARYRAAGYDAAVQMDGEARPVVIYHDKREVADADLDTAAVLSVAAASNPTEYECPAGHECPGFSQPDLDAAYARGIAEGRRQATERFIGECSAAAREHRRAYRPGPPPHPPGTVDDRPRVLRSLHVAIGLELARNMASHRLHADGPWEPAEQLDAALVHRCPPGDAALMPCCGRTPFEVPGDRMTTLPALVTCRPVEQPEGSDR